MARFPLPVFPEQNYHYCGIAFGASSKNRGTRRHAACDLIVPPGTPVLAVEQGIVLKVPKTAFFQNTYTVIVDHPNFIVRYAELDINRPVKEGDHVSEGQQIGTVGKNYKGKGMLHFEMYKKTATGPLTQTWNDKYLYVPIRNYQRRKDLMDPTPYLDQWKLWTHLKPLTDLIDEAGNWIEGLF
jgi:murein DD-endopeptidase MepM/ murein hydrolase activator NlpD